MYIEDLRALTFLRASYKEFAVKSGIDKVRKFLQKCLGRLSIAKGQNQIDAKEINEFLGLPVVVGNEDGVEPSAPQRVRQTYSPPERLDVPGIDGPADTQRAVADVDTYRVQCASILPAGTGRQ